MLTKREFKAMPTVIFLIEFFEFIINKTSFLQLRVDESRTVLGIELIDYMYEAEANELNIPMVLLPTPSLLLSYTVEKVQT